jgi:hypothetical protein
MISYVENKAWILRHSVQNARLSLDFALVMSERLSERPNHRAQIGPVRFVLSSLDRITVKTELYRTELSSGDCIYKEVSVKIGQLRVISTCPGRTWQYNRFSSNALVCDIIAIYSVCWRAFAAARLPTPPIAEPKVVLALIAQRVEGPCAMAIIAGLALPAAL